MVRVTPVGTAATSYTGSSARASTNYKTKISMVTNWQTQATSDAAESNYSTATAEAASAKRRQKALQSVSNADWQNRALTKGAVGLGTGISQSGDKYQKGAGPYFATLDAVSLPARTTDGMANLTARAGAIVSALIAKRKELKG